RQRASGLQTAIFLVAEDRSRRSFCVSIRDLSGKSRRLFYWIKEARIDDGLAELDKMTDALHNLPSTDPAQASCAAQTPGVYSNLAMSFSGYSSCSAAYMYFLSWVMADAGLVTEKVEKHSRDGEASLVSYMFCGLRWHQDQIEAKKEDVELLPYDGRSSKQHFADSESNPPMTCRQTLNKILKVHIRSTAR
ncbi:hypothetical protein CYMTET_53390, partial [Cymbomonas tetramitiformis]